MIDQNSVVKIVTKIREFQERTKTEPLKLYTPDQLVDYLASLDDESLQKTLQLAAMIAIGGNFSKHPRT